MHSNTKEKEQNSRGAKWREGEKCEASVVQLEVKDSLIVRSPRDSEIPTSKPVTDQCPLTFDGCHLTLSLPFAHHPPPTLSMPLLSGFSSCYSLLVASSILSTHPALAFPQAAARQALSIQALKIYLKSMDSMPSSFFKYLRLGLDL